MSDTEIEISELREENAFLQAALRIQSNAVERLSAAISDLDTAKVHGEFVFNDEVYSSCVPFSGGIILFK